VISRAQDDLFQPGVSARAKYQALVVGRSGFAALLRHELVTMTAQSRAGALGLLLRKLLYPRLLGACGRNVVFGQHVVLRHPHKIRIGVFVGRNTILSCKDGDITLDEGVNIGFNCEVFSASHVRIGARTLLAAYCYVVGGDHEYSDPTKPVLEQARSSRGVAIGTGAWLGAGVKVLDGASVGNGAIVGAGAVVRGDIPGMAIAVGVPARVVGSREAAAPGAPA
jgi:acetyltransferase-like isoleucine patch superfamily enzyme